MTRSLIHRLFSRKRWRVLQLITRVRRIHHPRWSFGWAFPFTTWCLFQTEQRASGLWDAVATYAPGWRRCERASYHDCTTTGRY